MKMNTKTSKQPKPDKPTARMKDLKPKKDTKGGARHPGGANFTFGDGSVKF